MNRVGRFVVHLFIFKTCVLYKNWVVHFTIVWNINVLLKAFIFQKDEKDGKKKERRPFDRNVDLQVNRFDDAQKKAIYKKAQLLDSRFSTGESKYL